MVWIGEKEIIMSRGWIVQYKDGKIICEDEMPWKKLSNKRDIKRVILKWEDRLWSLDDKEHYTAPTIRGYIDVNSGSISGPGIDSRTIGYYDLENKCKVYMRVKEETGKMTYETCEF